MILFNKHESSADKESACNARDPGPSPGWGRSPGGGKGCPLQYSWASLVAQLVKNLPAMWEIWVRSLGWDDPLEKGKAAHSSTVTWRNGLYIHGVAKSWTQLSDFTSYIHLILFNKHESSADKESACNAGDPGLIPGLGISPEEGIGYPL